MKNRVTILLLICLIISSCSIPERLKSPSIVGYVTSMNKSKDSLTILVEAKDKDNSKYDKASIRIMKSTKIYKNGKKTSTEYIEIGSKVEVEFEPQVAESYPVQATGKTLIILELDKD